MLLCGIGAGCAVPQVASAPAYWGVPTESGAGRRIVYRISTQQAWLIGDRGEVTDAFRTSGRRGWPRPGTYQVFRKINPGSSGSLRLPYFVGFAYGNSTDIGFHGIPRHVSDGSRYQTDAELGTRLSGGCQRQADLDADFVWAFADIGTTVVVI